MRLPHQQPVFLNAGWTHSPKPDGFSIAAIFTAKFQHGLNLLSSSLS